MMEDKIGPGSPAWEASEKAILAGVQKRMSDHQEALDEMTRHLVDNGASAGEIRAWECFVDESIMKKAMNEDGEWS